MTTKKLTKLLALYLPYILLGLAATNFGEAWRLAEGKELGDKIMSMMGTVPLAFANPLPSLHPLDLLVGLCCGAGLRLAVYLRGKNAKKYRHGMEYGSARWGTAKDIEPFMAPKFADNIIMLNQAAGDRQILAKQLNISPHQLSYVTHSGEGEGLLFFGNVILPFVDRFPTDLELYRIMTTKLGEVSEGAQK